MKHVKLQSCNDIPMTTTPDFKETQYAGRNVYGLSRRLVMAAFLFLAHYYSSVDENLGGGLLYPGVILIVLSIVLLFVPGYTIRLENEVLILKRTLGKEIRLPLEYIVQAEVVEYSKYHFNNIVFNVLAHNEYKFYTEGTKALLLNLKAGNTFRIGCKKADELLLKIQQFRKTV